VFHLRNLLKIKQFFFVKIIYLLKHNLFKMENYGGNESTNEVPAYSNYPLYNATYAPSDINGYYTPNGQYLYPNYYGGYYQQQQNNYNQYMYQYPNYNYNTPLESSTTLAVEKTESITNTSTESNVSSTSSASLTSVNGDYVTTISPVPNVNECPGESTPNNSLVANNQLIQNSSSFYPTPPSADVSNTSETNVANDVNRIISNDVSRKRTSKSPEVIPNDSDEENVEEVVQSRIKRRTRTQFNKYQIDYLEAQFNVNHYPDVPTVDNMAEKLGLAIERISVWFQNRRAKYKKTKKPSNFSAERLYSVS
jgi:hypothetical protein